MGFFAIYKQEDTNFEKCPKKVFKKNVKIKNYSRSLQRFLQKNRQISSLIRMIFKLSIFQIFTGNKKVVPS